jgi:glycosyltransferase involved in cell wall biosynthesis
MRIVIDARMYGGFGIGRYNRNLIANLQKIDSSNEYFILLRKEDFEKEKYTKNFTKVLADFHWYGLAEQVKLPQLIKSLRPDLVHFPHFNIPILYNGPFVVTIHDLIHQHFQLDSATTHGKAVYYVKKKGYELSFSTALKKSKKIITVSDYVKSCLTKEWQVEESKIAKTYEGVDDSFIQNLNRINSKKTLDKFRITKPYLFYVGNAHPHKNVERLIEAFLEVKKAHSDLQLVLSGKDDFFWERVERQYKNEDIKFTGYVDDLELTSLYREASAYVIPSLEEGFGIPLLEAMICKTPVVCSNAASLPEVAGEAAVYFDPKNILDMAEKITNVLDDKRLSAELIRKGLNRVKDFSWEKCAQETLDIYLI